MTAKRLSAGDAAPDFRASNARGEPRTLADFAGNKLWLCLFRYAACPFCAMRVHALVREQDRIRAAGIALVAVFPSKPERVRAYLDRYRAGFEILCDPEGAIHRAYGSETSVAGALKTGANPVKLARVVPHVRNFLAIDGPAHRMPAEFLIDEAGRIALAYYGTEIDDGIPVERALGWGAHGA